MPSNLPPGVTGSMIDRAMGVGSPLEAAEEWAIDELHKHCKTPAEYQIAVLAGIAAMQATRQPIRDEVKAGIDDFKVFEAEHDAARDYRTQL